MGVRGREDLTLTVGGREYDCNHPSPRRKFQSFKPGERSRWPLLHIVAG